MAQHAEKPVELGLRYVVAGDLSHIGFLRINLRIRYKPHSDGEETLGDTPCWRLELEPKSESAPFGRVRYWVAQDGLLPIRIEYYTQAGALLKTVRFTSYGETNQGLRPERIEIDDTGRTAERAKLTLSTPKVVWTKNLRFGVADLFVLRDSAGRLATESDESVHGEQLVDALLASARASRR